MSVSICHYLFLLSLRRTSAWTLYSASLEHNAVLTLSLLSSIVSPRWLTDALQVATLFFREIYRLHGLPLSIVSDRNSLWKQLRTSLDMSSAYHPQSDGQTEVTNRSLGNLLRCLVGDAIGTWDSKLPQAEFAHNHSLNRSLGFYPFQVVYGVVPHGPKALSTLPDRTQIHGEASTFFDTITDIHTKAISNLESSASKYKSAADTHRPRLVFQVGDLVWAYLTRDMMAAHAYNKLKAKKIGPLEVLERINDNAYRLRLPADINTSDV